MSAYTHCDASRQPFDLQFVSNAAFATPAFWSAWRTDKPALKRAGYRIKPVPGTKDWMVFRDPTSKEELRSLGLNAQWSRPKFKVTVDDVLRERGIKIGRPSTSNPNEHPALCPMCSGGRRTLRKRKGKTLMVLITAKCVKWICNHCQWSGRKNLL